ncbi:hypothetical protein chiPu_0023132, partial [Chiloscyllium punctatum]|nr:hypothetical protein [Chiloscyllium punctatum]
MGSAVSGGGEVGLGCFRRRGGRARLFPAAGMVMISAVSGGGEHGLGCFRRRGGRARLFPETGMVMGSALSVDFRPHPASQIDCPLPPPPSPGPFWARGIDDFRPAW